jgi:hypothetical protein
MDARHRARTLALASMLALTIISLPAAQAHAAPNTTPQGSCEGRGYIWDAKKGCADKKCTSNGVSYEPGSTRLGPPILGTKRNTMMCNGFTGKWDVLAEAPAPPTGPTGPLDGPIYSR